MHKVTMTPFAITL